MNGVAYQRNESFVINLEPVLQHDNSRVSKVKAQSFLCHSFPCQREAAHIRNRLVEHIEANDLPMVAYRYLQSMKGHSNTKNEAIFHVMCSIVWAPVSITLPSLIVSGSCLANSIINIRNCSRYKETMNIADDFLKKNLHETTYRKVIALGYSDHDLAKLMIELKDSHIDIESLRKKIAERTTHVLDA